MDVKTEKSTWCVQELTAGEDQLPHDSANVTNGSDNSKPKMLLNVFSSYFALFEKACDPIKSQNYVLSNFNFKAKHHNTLLKSAAYIHIVNGKAVSRWNAQ